MQTPPFCSLLLTFPVISLCLIWFMMVILFFYLQNILIFPISLFVHRYTSFGVQQQLDTHNALALDAFISLLSGFATPSPSPFPSLSLSILPSASPSMSHSLSQSLSTSPSTSGSILPSASPSGSRSLSTSLSSSPRHSASLSSSPSAYLSSSPTAVNHSQ